MVIKIPRGYIFPHSHHKSAPCPLAVFCFSLPLHLSVFVFLSLVSVCLPHSALCLFLCPHFSLSSDFSLSLNAFFCSDLSRFSFPLLSSLPVVLTSCPAIEGGRSRGGRGMLILHRRAERELEREGERQKCHSSEKMRWSLRRECVCACVCMHLNRKDQDDSRSDISHILPNSTSLPLLSK